MRTDQFSRLLLAIYLVALAVLLFVPAGRAMELGDRLNLEPFATIDRAIDLGPRSLSFRLMIANVAAFIPLGILLALAAPARARFAVVLVGAIALSSAAEIGQLAISVNLGYAYRSTDVDDVILNVTGALIGYAAIAITRVFGALQPSR
jgi:glycopeptide antibiotics resistance protein